MALNDVLRFSSVQYKVVEVKISEDIIQKKYLEMYLEDGLNELPEVGISDISLTGNLEKDLEQMQVFN